MQYGEHGATRGTNTRGGNPTNLDVLARNAAANAHGATFHHTNRANQNNNTALAIVPGGVQLDGSGAGAGGNSNFGGSVNGDIRARGGTKNDKNTNSLILANKLFFIVAEQIVQGKCSLFPNKDVYRDCLPQAFVKAAFTSNELEDDYTLDTEIIVTTLKRNSSDELKTDSKRETIYLHATNKVTLFRSGLYMHVGEAAKTHVLEKKPGLWKNISELKGEAYRAELRDWRTNQELHRACLRHFSTHCTKVRQIQVSDFYENRSYESSDGSKRAYTKIPEGIVQVIALKLYMDAREVVLATFGVDLDKKRELLRGVQLDFSLLFQADPGEGKRYVRVLKEETPIEDCANKKEWEQLNTLDGKGGFIPLSALDDTGTVLAGVDSDPPSPDLVGRR